jgi:hypothetical protein
LGRRATIRAKQRNRRIATISVVTMAIAAVLALVLIMEASSNVPGDQYSASIDQPVSPAVMQQITGVNDSTLSAIGLPRSVTPPATVTGSTLTLDAKPEILYIGGEYCPFCAVERWSLILALSHFGSFSGLEYMQSSSTDTNPNTPTFTFASATYTSPYISFVPVEELNRAGQTIATLTANESSLFSQYGMCAATGGSGGIPFIDIANAYMVNCGAQFSLPQIAGESWTQVASQLNTPNSTVAQEIDGAANTLVTAICKVDGGQPSSVCSQLFASLTMDGYTASASSSATAGPQDPAALILLLPQITVESRWTG